MKSFKITASVPDSDQARSLTGALSELVEPAPDAVSMFESPTGWTIEGYYSEQPDLAALSQQLAAAMPFALPVLEEVAVPDENWVAISQAALPPVVAGRFTVHGTHDRDRIPRGPNALIIDAGEAFGTAHHATTQGCLLAIDRLTRRRTFRDVLDIGCGSGVLAIASARALPHARVAASDNDPLAIEVARSNATVNAVAGRLRPFVAEGLPKSAARSGCYDLILANILADPLIGLAADVARALKPGGIAVLSGLLNRQAAQVSAAYRSFGLVVVQHQRIVGWSTLTLLKRYDGCGRDDLPKPVA